MQGPKKIENKTDKDSIHPYKTRRKKDKLLQTFKITVTEHKPSSELIQAPKAQKKENIMGIQDYSELHNEREHNKINKNNKRQAQ